MAHIPARTTPVPTSARVLLIAVALCVLASCGVIQPGTPGHEPPLANRYNPVSGEVNSSGR